MAELEGLIEEYAEADGVDRRRMPLLEAEILERAWRSGLAEDCGVTRSDAPRAAIAKLDAQLCDIKDLAIRDQSARVRPRAREPKPRAALAQATLASLGPGSPPGTLSAHRGSALRLRRQRARGPARRARRASCRAGPGGRADARAARCAANGPQPDDHRPARHTDAHGRGHRRARCRRDCAPPPAGSRRAPARAADRPVGVGELAHRRRRPRASARLLGRAAGLGLRLQPRHRHRGASPRPAGCARA